MTGKNKKNKNKPPNPVPPQEDEKPVETKTGIENPSEERVPEIVSEVLNSETKDNDNDGPKKPKRNRGKKKKNEQEGTLGDEPKGESEEQVDGKQNVPLAPVSRKKKGKPKTDDPVMEIPKTDDKVSEVSTEITENPKSPEPDASKTKKKNKKNKKRTDSEMSEKGNEISCTAAFQKILLPPEPKTDKKDKNLKEAKVDIETKKLEIPAKSETKSADVKTTGAIPIPPPPPPQEYLTKIQPVTDKSEPGDGFEEQKGKKKKKEKKYPKELEEQDLITALILGEAKIDAKPVILGRSLDSRKTSEKKDQNRDVLKDTGKDPEMTKVDKMQGKIATQQIEGIVVDEKKQKTEIETDKEKSAVEKDVISFESIEDKEIKQSDVTMEVISKPDLLNRDKSTKENKIKEEDSSCNTIQPKAKIAKPVEKKGKGKQNVDKPQPVVVDATESKSEDIPSHIETDIKCEIKSNEQAFIFTEESKEESAVIDKPVPETITSKKDLDLEMKTEEKRSSADEVIQNEPAELSSLKEKPIVIKNVKSSQDKIQTFDAENIESPKQKKKDDNKLHMPEISEMKNEENILKTNISDTEKIFEPIPDEISLSDIEKDVSMTPDITPDQIEHPRSSSEQLMDPNNNDILIQEISSTSLGVQVVIPDTPFITGSEEPMKVAGVFTSCIVTDIECPPPKDESTDLKSKVMEVNQDMEELRRSIERSLAEFTSLEKEQIGRQKRDDNLIIVTCAEVKTEVKSEPTKMIDATKLEKMYEIQEKSTKVQGDKEVPVARAELKTEEPERLQLTPETKDVPIPPQRKDNKGKNKSKKKGKQEVSQQQSTTSETTTTEPNKESDQQSKTESNEKKDKTDTKDEGKKQNDEVENKQEQANTLNTNKASENTEPIENFEDAMTSSVDDVNKTFEMIVNECKDEEYSEKTELENEHVNPVSQPKNLLGQNDIPVPSNRTDYKKEKNKTANDKQARVKIKDSVAIEKTKLNKECQTAGKPKYGRNKTINESVTCVTNENEEYVYKYSFRRVFLSNICHVCKKDLRETRVPCSFCYLIFYCSDKHKEDDVAQHSGLCFAISTIAHLKGQKHIYAEANGASGHGYRLVRMQAIISAEKILKRRLEPWEQEALLYPRLCAAGHCRQWRQGELWDCAGCGQISYCSSDPDHLPKTHARWCKSYSLYQKLVIHQLTQGRLEPKLPTKVLTRDKITDNINRLLADMYDEKIDMSDIQYASLTQLATAPLTTAWSHQLYHSKMAAVNGTQKSKTFTIHVVGAELQFEADSLNKWEIFFLHLKPEVEHLQVVLVGADLNPSNLPLDLLGKIKLCAACRVDRRTLTLRFHDKLLYHQYCDGDDFATPDIVCAFNPSIHRSSNYIRNDTWSPAINCILRSKKPFLVTSYTMTELQRDVATIKKCAEESFNFVSEPKFNPFASVRPDRNFISDDEIPFLFKNYCFTVLIGAF